MIARSVLAALVAGILAGLVIAAIHQVRLSPLIAAAESFEQQPAHSAEAHDHSAATAAAHDHGEGWKPAEGFERIAATTVAWALTGAGFGLLLAAASLLSGISITARNAPVWGICGFLAVSLAPAAGLAPELPGMPTADLAARQVWWVFAAAATGGGLLMLAKRPAWPWAVAAVALIIVPHIVGAPHPASQESQVPAVLAANFVGASLAVSALFWVLLGFVLGKLLPLAVGPQEAAR